MFQKSICSHESAAILIVLKQNGVAPTGSRLYRGLGARSAVFRRCRLPIGGSADYQSALRWHWLVIIRTADKATALMPRCFSMESAANHVYKGMQQYAGLES